MNLALAMVLVGLVAGVAGGMFGIGGGAIMVPALALLLGLEHKLSTGTSLGAQVLPVALLGALAYHRAGNLNWRWALLLAAGLLVGNFIGAIFANQPWVKAPMIKQWYGIFMIVIGLRYLFDETFKQMAAR